MKKIFILILVLTTNTLIAQKKTPNKIKLTQKTSPQKIEPIVVNEFVDFTSAIAGKYSKDLVKKMYNSRNVYGERKANFALSILGWKGSKLNNDKIYLVNVETSWKEGNGGIFNDWKDVSYKGVLMFNEFGCNPFFLITERVEPTIFGIGRRTEPIEEKTKEILNSVDDWTKNLLYVFVPDGCLE